MVIDAERDTERAIPDDVSDDDATVSDEATQRLLKGVLVALVVAVVLGAFAGAALWAAQGDDEPDVPLSAVDVGFLQDMLDHHDQALRISELYLENNPDGEAAPYALEVIMFQTRDIGWMEDWLAEEGYQRGEPGRVAMEWMGEPSPVADMEGMQPQELLDRLANATGSEADLLFFSMMSDHHLGGVHMADAHSANGSRPDIIDFSKSVSRNQQLEIMEYYNTMERLGLI